ncbi:hypothetical protein RJ639_002303 [Escallonia herrerae]|uniref:DIRP domain-containing protein n=1 Tax=Escallonia herrerae TaxID=1293975 RepID=A0AA88XGK3_9ASTE|nr:hypothetical protein RJ639_002303 [Escallonia herrerae]
MEPIPSPDAEQADDTHHDGTDHSIQKGAENLTEEVDLDLPIVLRKGTITCSQQPISNHDREVQALLELDSSSFLLSSRWSASLPLKGMQGGVPDKVIPYLEDVDQCTVHALKSYFVQAFAEAEGTLCTAQTYGPSEQWESRRPADCSSLGSDQTRIETDSAVLTSQVPTKDLVIVPTKRKSRRKMDPKRVPINKEMKSSEVIFNDWPYKYSTLQEKTVDLMPCWFSSLGKPRRFCENFLHEEREKLKQYRQSVRKHYSELRAGVREGLPTDLARPLSVGQRVIAIHPKSREVHDGRVLTVDHDKCRIQFDRPELGVEFVMASHGLKLGMVGFVLSQGMTDVQFQDIDCLPLNPLENMPEALRRQNIPIDRFSARTSAGYTLSENLENVESAMNTKSAKVSYGQPCSLVHIHAREADIFGLSELTRALDKKEAILMELKHVNNDLLKSRNTGDSFLKDSEPFRKQYAMLLQQLKEVSSALLNLRQRNTYPVNSLPPWPKAPAMPSGLLDPLDRFSTDPQEFGSNVVGIVTNSRSKAQTMVAAAIQAISSLKEGEDAFARLGEALDSSSSQNFPPDSVSLINRSPDQVSGFTPMPEPMIGHASGPMLPHDFGKSEGRIPSALVSSCVASLLMIQCSGRTKLSAWLVFLGSLLFCFRHEKFTRKRYA